MSDVKEKDIEEIINEISQFDEFKEIDIKQLVEPETGYAYKIAEYSYDNDLKSNQLRKIFDVIKNIEKSDKVWNDKKKEFYMLKPRLAVSVGRKLIPEKVYDVIIVSMNIVDVGDFEENFKHFVLFFESIIAYHKFLGGL